MNPLIVPFMKAAVSTGVVAGVGDSVYQWARNLKFSRSKRKGRVDSWDAARSAKVAIVAAAVGPILIFPSTLVDSGMDEILKALVAAGVVEACMVPFFYAWNEDLLFSYKSNLARLVVLGSAYTVGGSVAVAYGLDHLHYLNNLGNLGVLFPEGFIWTGGLGLTSFFYYSFAHQTALCMETKMNKDKDSLIRRAKMVGILSSASLLGVGLLDIGEYPIAHLFLGDVFCMSAMVYQCFLTYIQSLEAERAKAELGEDSNEVGKFLRIRTLLNLSMVSLTVICRPFTSSGQDSIALALQCLASFCWMAYFMTFDKEYEELDGDAGDWNLVSTDDEERAKVNREKSKKERAEKKRQEKEQRRKERQEALERKKAELLKELKAGGGDTSDLSFDSWDSDSDVEVKAKSSSKRDSKKDHTSTAQGKSEQSSKSHRSSKSVKTEKEPHKSHHKSKSNDVKEEKQAVREKNSKTHIKATSTKKLESGSAFVPVPKEQTSSDKKPKAAEKEDLAVNVPQEPKIVVSEDSPVEEDKAVAKATTEPKVVTDEKEEEGAADVTSPKLEKANEAAKDENAKDENAKDENAKDENAKDEEAAQEA